MRAAIITYCSVLHALPEEFGVRNNSNNYARAAGGVSPRVRDLQIDDSSRVTEKNRIVFSFDSHVYVFSRETRSNIASTFLRSRNRRASLYVHREF